MTAHEGVFTKKVDCETYMTTMIRHDQIAKEVEALQKSQTSALRTQEICIGSDEAEFEEKIPYLDFVIAPIK